MDDKAKSILNKLKSDFPGKTIEYQFANELHKFRIEEERVTYWLYVYRDYVDDTKETDLVTAIENIGTLPILFFPCITIFLLAGIGQVLLWAGF